MDFFDGYEVIKNDLACIVSDYKQIRFPKSKKKRIRKKWRKNNNNYGLVELHRTIVIDKKMYVSSGIYNKLSQKSDENIGE
jgi:hypothetical protein